MTTVDARIVHPATKSADPSIGEFPENLGLSANIAGNAIIISRLFFGFGG